MSGEPDLLDKITSIYDLNRMDMIQSYIDNQPQDKINKDTKYFITSTVDDLINLHINFSIYAQKRPGKIKEISINCKKLSNTFGKYWLKDIFNTFSGESNHFYQKKIDGYNIYGYNTEKVYSITFVSLDKAKITDKEYYGLLKGYDKILKKEKIRPISFTQNVKTIEATRYYIIDNERCYMNMVYSDVLDRFQISFESKKEDIDLLIKCAGAMENALNKEDNNLLTNCIKAIKNVLN